MSYTLDKIVREFLVESLGAEQIDNRYSRLLQIAINGLRDLHFDRPSDNSFAVLDVNDNDTVTLPNDYIDYIRIGVCFNGSIIALGENPIMCPPSTNDCGEITVDQPTTNPIPTSLIYDYPLGYPANGVGFSTYNLYGVGGGQNRLGMFKIFKEDGYIALQSLDTNFNQIILEYVSDIDMVDGEYQVNPYDVEAIKAWMWWKYIQRNKNYPFNEREMARVTYGNRKHDSYVRNSRVSLNEIISVIRSGYKSSPKL